MSVSGRVPSLKENNKSPQTNPRGANPRLCCLHCLRFSQAPGVKGFTAEKIWTISESQTWYLAGLGLLNGINKYIQHDGIYTNIHNYKHISIIHGLLFIIAEQWHLRWQPWHTYLHNPNSWGISGGHSKTGIPGMYEMIPSYHSLGYQAFKKELVYWPIIHHPTKRCFTYAERRVWNLFGGAGNSFPGQFHVIVPSGCIDAAKCPSVLSACLTKQTWELPEFAMYSLSTSISFPQKKQKRLGSISSS